MKELLKFLPVAALFVAVFSFAALYEPNASDLHLAVNAILFIVSATFLGMKLYGEI